MVLDNISELLKRISRAALRAGRSPEEVDLVAVTKTVGVDRIGEAVDAGLRVFAESRVQEAVPKIVFFRTNENIRWHLIGTLQTNKARKAVEHFDVIESVDSPELARRIDQVAGEVGKLQRVLIQVKLGQEPTKHGIPLAGVDELVERVSEMKHVALEGLMAIAPYFEDRELARTYFRALREKRDSLQDKGWPVKGLSMGMSDDFEVAIEEGATEVRIGTRIFGARDAGGVE